MLSLFTASVLSGITPFIAAFLALLCLKSISHSSSKLSVVLLGVSTGLMFAIATLELIPEAISLSNQSPSPPPSPLSDSSSVDSHAQKHRQPAHPHDDPHDHHSHGSHSAVQQNLTGIGVAFLLLLALQQLLNASGHSHAHGSKQHKKREPSSSAAAADASPADPSKPPSFRLMTLLALAVHSFIDGLVIASAYTASEGVGARVALAIILHKIPDGVLLTTLIVVSKQPGGGAIVGAGAAGSTESAESLPIWDELTLLIVLGLSIMTPLGSVITNYFLMNPDYNGFILAFGAGTFLFITTIEIIPELIREKSRYIPFISLIVGYLSFFVFEYIVHASEIF